MSTPEQVALQVGTQRVRDFVSYSVDADMYQAAAAWQLELAAHETTVRCGQECTLYLGDTQVLCGVVDRIQKQRSKTGGTQVTLTGRDLMGLVVDAYCEQWESLENVSLRAIAEQLLRNVPFISRKNIEYRNNAGRMSPKRAIQVEPGQTVFGVLREVAESRGLLFFCKPDGTLVFTRPAPKANADARARYSLSYSTANRSRILKANYVEDIAQRYSLVKIVGQQQGYGDIDAADLNVDASASDSTVPYRKVFVRAVNDDSDSPSTLARQTIEQQRWRGRELTYTVQGHRQGEYVWTIDEFCRVDDAPWGIAESMLVCGRTLRMSRDEGSVTDVRLCIPGVAG